MRAIRRVRLALLLPLLAFTPLLSACQVGYLVKSAYSQADLLRRRVPIEEALKDPQIPDETKRKLRLAQDARVFAETELGLKATQNYTSYVKLDRPYVTYVVSAAPKNKLEHYLWNYPLLGALPYKGYFDPDGAKEEADDLKKEDLDVYIRGVSAYSTLGWFRDPVLSSMMEYRDYDLVNTIIHETVHATIYIKSEADFNERLASFIGNKGTALFYQKREGTTGSTLTEMEKDAHDEKLFTDFISVELTKLEDWYKAHDGQSIPEDVREKRLIEIQTRFKEDVRPKMQLPYSFKGFETAHLNNARLLTYRLYMEDMSDFEKVFQKLGGDFKRMLEFCKNLEKAKDPKETLRTTAGT